MREKLLTGVPLVWSRATRNPRLTATSVSGNLRFVVGNRAPDEAWDLLGDRSRRAIVSLLADGPRAVVELANDLPISRPAVSQHLRVLKDAGLVHDEVVGTRRLYRLDPIAVAAFRDQLDTFWRRALAGYEDVVRAETPSRKATRKSKPGKTKEPS